MNGRDGLGLCYYPCPEVYARMHALIVSGAFLAWRLRTIRRDPYALRRRKNHHRRERTPFPTGKELAYEVRGEAVC